MNNLFTLKLSQYIGKRKIIRSLTLIKSRSEQFVHFKINYIECEKCTFTVFILPINRSTLLLNSKATVAVLAFWHFSLL